ncbi:MAG: XdhC family protein [Gemmatimonadota bacterium]|nr:XdhC family protein [Gemmatimonadota bacterium]
MSTHSAIINELSAAAERGDSTVLATVVRVTGSSYGGVGSRMLARVDGSTVGLVSGGCLESDLAEHAKRVSAAGRAEVVSYDTRNDEDAPWGLGLGCNGLIEVLLEPLKPAAAKSIAKLLDAALGGTEPAVIATVIRVAGDSADKASVGAHALIPEKGSIVATGNWGDASLLKNAAGKRAEAVAAGRRGFVAEFGGAEIAYEIAQPGLRLVVCGSGPDALPIASFGADLGWDVTVADHRPLTPEHSARFPKARVVYCEDALALSRSVSLTPRTAAVVVSHHFERDRNYLQSLLASDAAYIGMLGPRARTERMLADLAAKGIKNGDGDERLFAPVGMDIGGDGPDAIALAIVAEVASVMGGRSGMHLRDKRGPLHAATGTT